MAQPSILVAGATRPRFGETANGDAWRVDWQDGTCRIAVIDGLGHGPDAAKVASDALNALAATESFDPAESLRACQRALSGGRGAAISIVRVDPVAGELVFAGIGNVEAALWATGREQRLSPDRGIVGSVTRTLHPLTIPLSDAWLLLIHSDGISSRFRLADLREQSLDSQQLADAVLEEWGRSLDDATVVVARAAPYFSPERERTELRGPRQLHRLDML